MARGGALDAYKALQEASAMLSGEAGGGGGEGEAEQDSVMDSVEVRLLPSKEGETC